MGNNYAWPLIFESWPNCQHTHTHSFVQQLTCWCWTCFSCGICLVVRQRCSSFTTGPVCQVHRSMTKAIWNIELSLSHAWCMHVRVRTALCWLGEERRLNRTKRKGQQSVGVRSFSCVWSETSLNVSSSLRIPVFFSHIILFLAIKSTPFVLHVK